MTHNLTVLHTNDLHGRLTEEHCARLREMKAACGPDTLLLDAGDAVTSGNVTFRPRGEPTQHLMSRAGYDAMAVGNREFHFSRAGFTAKTKLARFPVLCANVRPVDPEAPLPVRRQTVLTMPSGLRVGLFGLTVPMITERMLARKVSAYVFDDPIRTATALVPDLRGRCDLVICLSHIGIGQDRRLAAEAPGIDLIVGGHTHARLDEGESTGRAFIVQAAAHAACVGTVHITCKEGGPVMTANLSPL